MTVTSERTMTLDGQIAIPLDTAANREPFLELTYITTSLCDWIHRRRWSIASETTSTVERVRHGTPET